MTLTKKDFKEGLSITCNIDVEKIDYAKLHFEDDTWYICQNIKDGDDCKNKLGYKYAWKLFDGYVSNIQLKEKTMYNLEEGDIIINPWGDERMILGFHKFIYHLSKNDDFEISNCDCTPQELTELGYKLKQPSQSKTKLSMDEIAKKFDIPVNQLEIIKEK